MRALATGLVIIGVCGCEGSSTRGGRTPFDPKAALAPAVPTAAPTDDRAAAMLGDRRITWVELAPMLAEAAGYEVLEEHVLGLLIERELASRRPPLRVDERMVSAERELLGRTLARSVGAPETESERLIADVRARRALGDLRFRGLLRRNAGLRLLVRSDPALGQGPALVGDEDVRIAYGIRYGPRVRARLIVVLTADRADEAQRLAAQQPFAEVASLLSIDPSREVGGLLEPFSLDDPAYPVAVRAVLTHMEAGAISQPVNVSWNGQDAFAIVRLEERLPPPTDAPTLDQARADLVEEVRLVRERGAMDTLARRLLAANPPTVLDRSMGWSWDNHQRSAGGRR